MHLFYKEHTGDHNHSKNFAYRSILFLKTEITEQAPKEEREKELHYVLGIKLATKVFLAPGRKVGTTFRWAHLQRPWGFVLTGSSPLLAQEQQMFGRPDD